MPCAGVYGILCKRVFFLKRQHAIVELNREAVQCGFPVMNRHSPSPADVVWCQIQQLARGLVGGERTAVLNDFAQAHVNRFWASHLTSNSASRCSASSTIAYW